MTMYISCFSFVVIKHHDQNQLMEEPLSYGTREWEATMVGSKWQARLWEQEAESSHLKSQTRAEDQAKQGRHHRQSD